MQFRAVLCLAALGTASAVRAKSNANADSATMANPIRKVVTMLQGMQKKIEAEGEKEKDLYEKFMCFCKDGGSDLQGSISAAETKVPQVGSDIEAAGEKLTQLKEDLKQAQVDRGAAKAQLEEATALREKEAAAFADEKAEYDTNIQAINKAVTALEKGAAGSFLQTDAAQVIKALANKMNLIEADRAEIAAFLSGGAGYAPQSGQITGILKQMGGTAAKALADATAAEEGAIKAFGELSAAKEKEIKALTAAIETKTVQIGELGVKIVQMKQDLKDTQEALAEDQKFLANLQEGCATKTAEWEERSKTRAEEQVALAETIKILNDDDALELFKKTLPSPSTSFVQFASKISAVKKEALALLRRARGSARDRTGLDQLVLALTSRQAASKVSFEKVIKMIDEMVKTLETEALDDEHKKEYCGTQFDLADDKKKALEREVSDETNSVDAATEAIATLTAEIKALEEGIKELDKSVAEATEQRKQENVEFKEFMASDGAAKELLGLAKNRLNKFYNPKLYVAPAKRELSEEDRIHSGISGTEPPSPAPGGIAGTGVTAFVQFGAAKRARDAPPPPPETWDAYAKKSDESTGVIGMIDLLVKDLEKEMTEAETEEKNSQAEYEKLMQDSAEKRTVDSKSLAEKGSTKADTEEALESHKQKRKDAGAELMATMKYISSLHAECDWLLKYFDVRKEAREGEIDAMKKAKAVLSGADYSLLQMPEH